MLKIDQLKLRADENQNLLEATILKKLHLNQRQLLSYKILKRSLDARDKKCLFYIYSLVIEVSDEHYVLSQHHQYIHVYNPPLIPQIKPGIVELKEPVVIVGMGPAGLFCALKLVRYGYPIILLERGKAIKERSQDVNRFFTQAILDEDSNIQFGEGGAGTFSDGKLTARSKDIRVSEVYDTFVEFGADEAIAYEAYPHVGSDKLKIIIPRISEEIKRLGGVIVYNERVERLVSEEGKITGVVTQNHTYHSHNVVLALGNSARDSFINFYQQGLHMENKPFAIGLRIEHHQKMIDNALYHQWVKAANLHAASYRLTHQCDDGRGVYTFCMCPGGSVVAATSAKNQVCVNGMSEYARDGINANSALLVQVGSEDYGDQLFDGLKYQETLEKATFTLGGGNYQAPVQLVKDFLNDVASEKIGLIKPTYPLGIRLVNLRPLLGERVSAAISEALLDYDHKIAGFAGSDAILTAIETRTSSPLRILRNREMESVSLAGVYPCGEGSGYAGGIVSSAVDGIKVAEKLIEKYHINK